MYTYRCALKVEKALGEGKLLRLSVSAWNETPPIEQCNKTGDICKKIGNS